MRPEPIVKVDPSADFGTSFGAGFKSVQIHAFILERAPEEFDEDIVQPAATAIHGNADIRAAAPDSSRARLISNC